jgi:hypothetical protein
MNEQESGFVRATEKQTRPKALNRGLRVGFSPKSA